MIPSESTKKRQDQSMLSTAAGFSAIFIGLGLNRFSYVAFIPILIGTDWLTPEQAGYLGAANLLGYLAGALSANRTAITMGPALAIRANLALSVISFFACAWPLGLEWLTFWRLMAGVTGAQLMVIAVPAVLSAVPLARKGQVSGMVFSGIGFGIIFSGLALPLLADLGITQAWLALGSICLLFTLIAWNGWPGKPARAPVTMKDTPSPALLPALPFVLLLGAYALDAVGYVPHTVYWVDFIARDLDHGSRIGGLYWMILGAGAVFGPILAGRTADRFGFKYALLAALMIKAGAIALPLASTESWALAVSSLLVGALTPGMVALVSGFTAVLIGPERNRQAWGWMTFAFAIAQAMSGYAMAWLFAQSQSYFILFQAGCLAMLAGALLIALSPRPSKVAKIRN